MAGRPKSTLAKAAGAEPSGQMRAEKSHSAVARSTFAHEKPKTFMFEAFLEVQMSKKCTPLWREATCGSQHVQSTPFLDNFW